MPGEVLRIGAEGGLRGEGEGAAVEVGEFEVGSTGEDGFGDVGLGDADTQVVVHGPEAGVEEVVGGRSQGQAVVGAIGSLAGMRVDVGGL